MPPKKQLSEKQIALLRDWVKTDLKWDAQAFDEDPFYGHSVVLAPLPAQYQPVLAVAVSPDGKHVAFGRGGLLSIHEVGSTNYPAVTQIEACRDAIQSLAWTPDSQTL